MGVVERIKQIQLFQEEQTTREKADKVVLAKNLRQEAEKVRFENEALEKENLRRNRELTEKAFKESAILENLQKIERELLRGSKHKLVYTPEKCQVILVCGKSFVIENGDVVEPEINGRSYQYALIKVSLINPDSNLTLFVEGKDVYSFNSNELKDKNGVEEAIAKAYLNPKRVNYTYYYHPKDDVFGGGARG